MSLEDIPSEAICSFSPQGLCTYSPSAWHVGSPSQPRLSLTLLNGLVTSFPQGLGLTLNVSSSKKSSLTSSIPGLSAHQVPLTLHHCDLFVSPPSLWCLARWCLTSFGRKEEINGRGESWPAGEAVVTSHRLRQGGHKGSLGGGAEWSGTDLERWLAVWEVGGIGETSGRKEDPAGGWILRQQ